MTLIRIPLSHGISAIAVLLNTLWLTPATRAQEGSAEQAAAIQLAIAAQCRANYGDDQIFEVAFEKFVAFAGQMSNPPSKDELAETKQRMQEIDASEGDNLFLRGFCKKLRETLIPE